MAKMMVLVDDLDNSTTEVETIKFSLDGSHFEVDLSRGNATELRTMLAPYQAVARRSRPYSAKSKDTKPAGSKRSAAKRKPRNGVPTASEVRAWAREHGIDVTPTGRVPKSLVEQYVAGKS